MRIEWTEPAVADLENIRLFFARDSVTFADRIVEKILEAVDRLASFPNLGRTVQESEDQSIRQLLVLSYRIIYKIEFDRVVILIIVHTARDVKPL